MRIASGRTVLGAVLVVAGGPGAAQCRGLPS
jgi:hypothetical protein